MTLRNKCKTVAENAQRRRDDGLLAPLQPSAPFALHLPHESMKKVYKRLQISTNDYIRDGDEKYFMENQLVERKRRKKRGGKRCLES